MSVLIVVPPFSSIEFPSIGASLLATQCRAEGLDVRIRYASIKFCEAIGYERYRAICSSPIEKFVGEQTFKAAAFPAFWKGCDARAAVSAMDIGPDGIYCVDGSLLTREDLASAIEQVAGYVEREAEHIVSQRPRIVGFSSVFQQNCASIALARRIKQMDPAIRCVLGGANANVPMGREIVEKMDCFDTVIAGEADEVFPQFCRDVLTETVKAQPRFILCDPCRNLDATPLPDYSEYFDQLHSAIEEAGIPRDLPVGVHFESARGCWWGQKMHCKFCGLNPTEMGFRAKSGERILSDIRQLRDRYGVTNLFATDNIMPRCMTEQVLPALAEERAGVRLFYEVKANLRPEQLDIFARGGLRHIQPGIESLSSNVLKLLDKGVTAHQNLMLLRDCLQRGITVSWNHLIGIPGEKAQDYREILDMLPRLTHLEPPETVLLIRIDRYSPYFDRSAENGIEAIKPLPPYQNIYPPDIDLHRIAYHFEGRYSTELLDAPALLSEFIGGIDRWRMLWADENARPRLTVTATGAGAKVVDERMSGRRIAADLSKQELELLFKLQKPARANSIQEQSQLEKLDSLGLVARVDGMVLALVSI